MASDSKETGLAARVVDYAVGRASDAVDGLVARFDSGWINRLTGLGTTRDKRVFTEMEWDPIGDEELERLYRGSSLHARVVDLPADECFRTGFEVRIPSDAGLAQAVNSKLAELDTLYHLQEADRLSRLYRGALVLVGTRDRSGRPADVLRMDQVESVDFLNHFSSREAWAWDYYGEINRKGYGTVASYQLSPLFGGYTAGWEHVHASRTLRFDGVRLERHTMQYNLGWGDSVLQRVHDTIRDWASSYNGVSHLLADANQGVFKMPNLIKLISQNQADVVAAKFAMMDQARSNLRAILLSGEESFERVATTFTGIPDALARLDFMLSAVIGYPVTVLFGQAPAGLNATGMADLQLFREAMGARRVKSIQRQIEQLVRLIFLSKRGPSRGKEPARWSIVWKPLAEMTPTERATYRKTVMETDTGYIREGVLTQGEVARSRFGGDEYSDETGLDPELERVLPTDEPPEQRPEGAPPPGSMQPGEEGAPPLSSQALNGAQVEGMMAIVDRVATGQIPRATGVAALLVAFRGLITAEEAENIMGDVGRTFFVATPEKDGTPGAGG
jgi:uncharacterized protein